MHCEATNASGVTGAAISREDRAVAALSHRRTEKLYRTLIESLPQHVFFKDTNSVFVSVNAAFAADFGKKPEDFVGKSDFDLFPKELAAKYAIDDQRIMTLREPETFEEMNVVRGKKRYVEVTKAPVIDDEGEVIGLLGIFTDVTERHEAQEELTRSQAFLNSVIENLPIMVFIKRASDLKFVLWNKAGERLTGHSAAEYLGKNDYDFFSREEADAYTASDRETLNSGRMVETPDEIMSTPHKGARILHTKKIPIFNERGEAEYLLGISEDVTEQKVAEEKLQKFAAQLEQNNRELQDFAYVASHDLQEPLRKVRALGDRLNTKYGTALGDDGRDYLSRMLNAARRMQTLIEDLLSFSRVTTRAQPFVSVNLNTVAREVVSDLEVRIEQTKARVEVGELPEIEADATQMRQIVQNLIGNALKFHRKDETPVVKVYAKPVSNSDTERLKRGAPPSPQKFQLFVEDNGIGFDEKYLDRIFTVFQRLHGRGEYEGTGVGLAICRKIALRHGGDITARSQPGAGATFIVTLPFKQPKND